MEPERGTVRELALIVDYPDGRSKIGHVDPATTAAVVLDPVACARLVGAAVWRTPRWQDNPTLALVRRDGTVMSDCRPIDHPPAYVPDTGARAVATDRGAVRAFVVTVDAPDGTTDVARHDASGVARIVLDPVECERLLGEALWRTRTPAMVVVMRDGTVRTPIADAPVDEPCTRAGHVDPAVPAP